MYASILFRMILWDLAKVFAISLVGITGVLLMAGIIAEATQQGLGPAQLLVAIPLLIPSMLPYTIPATTLFAVCVVYGRLAADNELLAIKAAGCNLAHVVKPALLLGLAMSGCTLGLYYHLIPHTHFLLRSLVFVDAEKMAYAVLARTGTISNPRMAYTMFVRGVQGRNLIDPLVKRHDERGGTDLVAQARTADLRVDLLRRQLQVHMHFGVAVCPDGTRAYFEDRVWEVPMPDKWETEAKKRPRALTWPEIAARREQLQAALNGNQQKIAEVEDESIPFAGPRENRAKHRQNLGERQRSFQHRLLELDVERLMRPALALGCFCFVLVGCPVGIWLGRGDFLSAFVICFLPICFLYYPLFMCGTNLAKEGNWNPLLLLWGANLCIGAIGLGLLVKLIRR